MITELKSVRDIWKRMPTERHARQFLKNAIWGDDRFCRNHSIGTTCLIC